MSPNRTLLSETEISLALRRMTLQIMELVRDPQSLCLCGVQTRGVPLANRLATQTSEEGFPTPPVGILDINLYRDDLEAVGATPILHGTNVPFSLENRVVVLVDDVLFTGRTIRAALDALVDLGRPRRVFLAVLVDRGHRELPIHPDVVGLTLPTQREDQVILHLSETDGEDSLHLITTPTQEAS